MTTDATGLISVQQFQKMGGRKVFDPRKVVFIMDHFTPCRNIESAEVVKELRAFAWEQGLVLYDVGRAGICHTILPDDGLVLPGDILVGGILIPPQPALSGRLQPVWVPPILRLLWPPVIPGWLYRNP